MTDRSGAAPVPGTALHYEIAGAGDPIVFMHGFSLDLRLWDDQAAAIASRYMAVRYDLRGFGKSAPSHTGYTHADDLKALLDHLGIARATLVGLSMGGGAAINFALTHPEAVHALVLVGSTVAGHTWSKSFKDAEEIVHTAAKQRGVDVAKHEWLRLRMFRAAMANATAATSLERMVGDYSGWHWLNSDPGLPLRPLAAERLSDVIAPTLVVLGELDDDDFHDIAGTLERGIPRARKVTIAGAGHLPNLERPAEFNTVLTSFLAETHHV